MTRRSVVAGLGLVVAVGLLVVSRQAWAGVGDPPLPSVAFVARADNPVDALAASSMAGQLGAPVFLTFPDSLHPDASAGLANTSPDTVVLAGGTAALSEAVENQIGDLLPDATIIRKAGTTRTSTATALAGLPAELGFTRPVLTGAAVPGDAAITGELTVAGTDVSATLQVLTDRVTMLEDSTAADARMDQLEADLAAATDRIGTLEDALTGPFVMPIAASDFQPRSSSDYGTVEPSGIAPTGGSAFFDTGLPLPVGTTIHRIDVYGQSDHNGLEGLFRGLIERKDPLSGSDDGGPLAGGSEESNGERVRATIDVDDHVIEEGWVYRITVRLDAADHDALFGAEVHYTLPSP